MKTKTKGAKILIVLIMIYLLIPLTVTIIYSLFEKWTGILPEHFSFQSYVTIFQDPEFLRCIGRTVFLCVIPIAVTTMIVLLALFVAIVCFPQLEKWIQLICMIPYTIQGVILSVSILSLYVSNKGILGNRLMMLLEAAEMLGATRFYTYFKIVVPNILSSIIVSALLAVGIIFGDYVLVRNLCGTSFQNMQIYLYQMMKSDSTKSSAVFVVIMAITFLITAVVLTMQKKEKH
ncbi:ABC transporter permease subunit [bacterium]|nr:ABC transporter permease subunit [bacterium]